MRFYRSDQHTRRAESVLHLSDNANIPEAHLYHCSVHALCSFYTPRAGTREGANAICREELARLTDNGFCIPKEPAGAELSL